MSKIGEFKPKKEFLSTIEGEITKEHLKWSYGLGMTFRLKRHTVYKDYNLSLQKECHGNRTSYYIDGDEREFKTAESMLIALNELLKAKQNGLEKI